MNDATSDDDYPATLDPRMSGVGLTPSELALLDCLLAVQHDPTYTRLYARGIHGAAVTGAGIFNALHVEPVCFQPGQRFEFARDMCDASGHMLAVIIPACGESGETIDLAAWALDSGSLATWRGVASMLGEDNIDAPRIECDGLRVHPGPAQWLRAGRLGVVILDAERARWRLAEERLIVADAEFGRRLREALELPRPRIFVETTAVAA